LGALNVCGRGKLYGAVGASGLALCDRRIFFDRHCAGIARVAGATIPAFAGRVAGRDRLILDPARAIPILTGDVPASQGTDHSGMRAAWPNTPASRWNMTL